MTRVSPAERIVTKLYLGVVVMLAVLGVVTTLAGLVLLVTGSP